MRSLSILSTLLVLAAGVNAFADSSIIKCTDSGYITTSTEVWKEKVTGKIKSFVEVSDIENPGNYHANYRGLKVIKGRDGSITISSRSPKHYLLKVAPDRKSAVLSATNVESIELACTK